MLFRDQEDYLRDQEEAGSLEGFTEEQEKERDIDIQEVFFSKIWGFLQFWRKKIWGFLQFLVKKIWGFL